MNKILIIGKKSFLGSNLKRYLSNFYDVDIYPYEKIKKKVGLNKDSNVMLIGCEGDTDEKMYQKLINQ